MQLPHALLITTSLMDSMFVPTESGDLGISQLKLAAGGGIGITCLL
jgi:hypothetical protein